MDFVFEMNRDSFWKLWFFPRGTDNFLSSTN